MKEGISVLTPQTLKGSLEDHEQLYSHKFDSLCEINKFLKIQTTKSRSRIDNMNSPTSTKEMGL